MEVIDLLDLEEESDDGEPVPKRHLLDIQNPIEVFGAEEFTRRYRFSKETVVRLFNIISKDAELTSRSHALDPLLQVLCALRFFATGDFQQAGSELAGVSRCTAQRSIHKVTRAICRKKAAFLSFPADLEQEKTHFYDIAKFPDIVGVVDCTDIPIFSPGGNDSIFKNRKGTFCLRVQVICNSQLLVTNIVARWPGSTPKSKIFENSVIRTRFENEEVKGILLGGNEYPCEPYLMTPFLSTTTPGEAKYNKAHMETSLCMKRCITLMKNRFGCLSIPLRTRLDNTMAIVVAVACLHNFAILTKQPSEFDLGFDSDEPDGPVDNSTPEDLAVRDAIIQQYFSNSNDVDQQNNPNSP